ncbi:hypothetical protein [Fictibacillus gelatini]|uniref:hypothetical protein n=1 Tax=Fictibacillus gelatini TaxID=225985 RepID=UPI0004013980|nr:hypothetical protein [Fictibacillus gelatini]
MSNKLLMTMRDFSAGINDKDAPNLIPDNALVDAQNAILGRGYASKRYGYSRYTPNSSGFPINKLYLFNKNDGTTELLAVGLLKLNKDSNGVLSSIPSSPTFLTSNNVQMITYKDRNINDVVLLADQGKLKRYNGTDVAEVTAHVPTTDEQTSPGTNDLINLTNFRCMAIKKDRIFAAAHPTVKNRVSFCYHDPYLGYAVYDYWPATYFFDVAPEENDEIVQLKVFRDALLILMKRSLWILRGDGTSITDYELSRVNVPAGCISPNSVQIVGNNVFYLAEDHVYALFSTDQNYISAKIVSESIEKTLAKYSLADKSKAVGHFYNNKYYLAFPDGTCLIYDVLLGSWVRWTNIKANSFLTKDGELYFSTNAGLIHKFKDTIFNDDGAPIAFYIRTKILDLNTPVQDKKFKRLWMVFKQYDGFKTSYAIQSFIDYFQIVDAGIVETPINEGAIWDESNWDEAEWDFSELLQTVIKLGKKGKNIQLMISNDNLDEPITIYGITIEYKVKNA